MGGDNLLDAKDRAILYNLDLDARQSNSSIARKTKLSKEVVNYRIKNLTDKGIVNKYCTIIDSSKLGYMVYRVFIKFQNVNVDREREIIDYLRNQKSVGWVVLLEEMYDLAILVWARNIFEFKETYDTVMAKYGEFFQENFVTVVTHIHHFVNNHLFSTSDLTERVIGGKFVRVSLDESDMKILSCLAGDARMPLLDLARKVGVSPNTVKQRINKMKDRKVIVGFKAKINSGKLGYLHYKIFLQLAEVSPDVKLRLREFLKLNQNVIYITEAIGRADFEFEIQVRTSSELRKHLKSFREYFGDSIKGYSTTLVNKEYTVNYFPSRCLIEESG